MNIFRKIFCSSKCLVLVLLGLWLTVGVNAAHAEWQYGIGTGIFRWNIDGKIGFNSPNHGPVEIDTELNPSDIDRIKGSAIGFAGFASNGTWNITGSFMHAVMEDDDTDTNPFGEQVKWDAEWDITNAELFLGRHVYKSKSFLVGVSGGVRFFRHDWEIDSTVLSTNDRDQLKVDAEWADIVIGGNILVPFLEKWRWNTTAQAGFGEDSTHYELSTGVSWKFHKHWSIGANARYLTFDYEDGNKGDSDWYSYDADEFGWGLTAMFTW